ncbi:unnamed protein product [Closterium sp. NIES-53]
MNPPTLVMSSGYVARVFSQRQGVDYFQTFSPTRKMTTLRVLLHVAAQRDYDLHSLDFSTAFLQGSLHEEIWLRRPSGFTGSFSAGTQWSLQRPVYGLRQAPSEWHDILRTTLVAMWFTPSTGDPLLFLRTDTSLPLFYVLVYVDDLVFATAYTEALTLLKSFSASASNSLAIAHSSVYQPLALSSTFGRVRRAEWSVPRACGLPHVSDDVHTTSSRVPSQPPGSLRGSWQAPKGALGWCEEGTAFLVQYVGHGALAWTQGPVIFTGHADASWVDDSATQRSSQGYSFSLGCGSVSSRSTRSSSVLSSSCEAEIYAGAMAAQELCWLTYLLTHLGEQPRLPPILFVDNKARIALYQEHRLEHRTKHIALHYFLTRELQQRGHLRLAYVATRANIADIFTKAFPPGDHQRFSTVLGLRALVFLTAEETARLFIATIVRLHGIPVAIINDRDTKFTSNFWKNLWEQFGTRLQFRSSYHPETGGQTQRTNQTMEQLISATCDDPTLWEQQLSLIECRLQQCHVSDDAAVPVLP